MDKLFQKLRIGLKISGVILSSLLILIVAGNIIDPIEGERFLRLSLKEWFVFLLFPVCPITGYLFALKKEFSGNMIVIAGMVLLHVMRPDLLSSGIALLGLPAVLSLVLYSLKKQ